MRICRALLVCRRVAHWIKFPGGICWRWPRSAALRAKWRRIRVAFKRSVGVKNSGTLLPGMVECCRSHRRPNSCRPRSLVLFQWFVMRRI